MEIIPKPVRTLWNNWDIRIFVLCSLFVQILLIFFAQIRKRTANKFLILFTWSLYLLADWVAALALGLLANSETSESDCALSHNIKAAAAPSPPPLGFIFEVGVAFYVFLLSLPETKLLVPTLFIFVAGVVKYLERTYALYLASLNGFRDSMLEAPDPGPNYAKLMEEYQSKKEAGIPVTISISPEPEAQGKPKEQQDLEQPLGQSQEQLKAAKKAFELFQTFKGLIVDLMFSFHDRTSSRSAFIGWRAEYAFRVIEYELEFVYEVLFTKAAVVHKTLGYFLRALCSCSITAAFFFFLFTSKHDFPHLDVAISYTLLVRILPKNQHWTEFSFKNSPNTIYLNYKETRNERIKRIQQIFLPDFRQLLSLLYFFPTCHSSVSARDTQLSHVPIASEDVPSLLDPASAWSLTIPPAWNETWSSRFRSLKCCRRYLVDCDGQRQPSKKRMNLRDPMSSVGTEPACGPRTVLLPRPSPVLYAYVCCGRRWPSLHTQNR